MHIFIPTQSTSRTRASVSTNGMSIFEQRTAVEDTQSQHSYRQSEWCSNTVMSTRLHDAVKHGRLYQIKQLLELSSVDVNARDASGATPLILTLHSFDNRKRSRMFNRLMQAGANPCLRDHVMKRDCLEWAVSLGCEREALILLDDPLTECDTSHRDAAGLTLLHHAVQASSPVLLKELCQRNQHFGVSVDVNDQAGFTPYLLAVKLGYRELAGLLVEFGASPNQGDSRTGQSLQMIMNSLSSERRQAKRRQHQKKLIELQIQGKLPAIKRYHKKKKMIAQSLAAPPHFAVASANSENPRELQVETFLNTLPDARGVASCGASHPSSRSFDSLHHILSLKNAGNFCEQYKHSVPENAGSTATSLSGSIPRGSASITAMFEELSHRMSLAYCTAAREREPLKVKSTFHVQPKTSTLATIMKKPLRKRNSSHQLTKPKALNRTTLLPPITAGVDE